MPKPILSNTNLADHLTHLHDELQDWAATHNFTDVLLLAAERLRETPDTAPTIPLLVNELNRIAVETSDSDARLALNRVIGI